VEGILELRPLGTTGVSATALGLGTAALAVPYGAPQGERAAIAAGEAQATIERAMERGVRFVDTAPAYGDAERLVGAAVAGTPDCVVATKVAVPDHGWATLDDRQVGDHVRASAEASLRALGRDVLDVLGVHNAEPEVLGRVAVAEALAALRAEGLVRLTGATVYGPEAALAAVAREGMQVVQIAMNALDLALEREVVPEAGRTGTALIVRSVLLRGVLTPAGERLTGPFAPLRAAADGFRRAAGAGWSELPGAATAFMLARPGIASVLLGPRDAAELDELLDGAERFATATRSLDGSWGAGLPAELLDPRAWPALEAQA
jgi:aryl-alcohol dehydrogenase-like predicted oxidoreductase